MGIQLKEVFRKEVLVRTGQQVMSAVVRFPLVMAVAVFLAGVLIYQVDLPYEQWLVMGEPLERLTVVALAGLCFALFGEVLIERVGWKLHWGRRISLYAVQTALLFAVYRFWLPSVDAMVPVLRLILLAGACLAGFIWVPYSWNREHAELYVIRLVTRWFVTLLYAVVLGLGLSSVLFAVESLLLNGMNSSWYAYLWILNGTLFVPLFFLSALPGREDELTMNDFDKIFRGLLLYIVLPVLASYTMVLYAYFVRILITRSWPSDQVSYLVAFYGTAGFLTVFLIQPLRGESLWADRAARGFRWVIIPLLVMMAVSIGMRVDQYGITERRYFVILLGVWFGLNTAFLQVFRGRRNLLLAVSLTGFLVVSAVGPYSAFAVSRWSQNERLDRILRASVQPYGDQEAQQIIDILHYFNRNHDLDGVRALPDGFSFDEAGVQETFGFSLQDLQNTGPERTNMFSYWRPEEDVLMIEGFERSMTLLASAYERPSNQLERSFHWQGSQWTSVVTEGWILVLEEEGQERLRWDLAREIEGLVRNQDPEQEVKQIITGEKVVWDRASGDLRVRLIVQSLEGHNGVDGVEPLHLSGILLVGQ